MSRSKETGQLCESKEVHTPVLLNVLSGILSYPDEGTVVDATIGYGGHALEFGGRLTQKGLLIGLDVDDASLTAASRKLEKLNCRVKLVRENFGRLDEVLEQSGIGQVDLILADLGVSSGQLADAERGISFQYDGPLDMRMDTRLERTAADLVNGLGQDDLANLIFRYGEERRSRRIARGIVMARREKPFERTLELVKVIIRSLGITTKGRKSRIHPATRTFQALRIAVNDELGQLETLLQKAPQLLKTQGQIAIISFHSLEDRLVKYNFRENHKNGFYEILTKKPLVADNEERQQNPRSRSAKLRVARKVEARQ